MREGRDSAVGGAYLAQLESRLETRLLAPTWWDRLWGQASWGVRYQQHLARQGRESLESQCEALGEHVFWYEKQPRLIQWIYSVFFPIGQLWLLFFFLAMGEYRVVLEKQEVAFAEEGQVLQEISGYEAEMRQYLRALEKEERVGICR